VSSLLRKQVIMVVLIMAVPNVDGQFMKASEGQFLAGIQRTCGNRCFKARSWTCGMGTMDE